jgi:predicted XRE-type DNA-binding protein
MGWTQSTVSGLLRGDLEDYSIKRINKALAVFGAEIETKVVNTLKLPPAQHAAE